MINTELYSDFCFLKIAFNKFHYTDNRTGSPFHYIAYMEKGSARIVSKGKTIYVNEGDVFYIPKNLSYQSYWYGDDEIVFYSYGCKDFFANDAKFLDLQLVDCHEELKAQLISVPTEGTEICMQTMGSFFTIVSRLLPYMKKTYAGSMQKTLAHAKKQLHANPYLSNTQLATQCNISLPYLYKIFKTCDGETPNSFRQRVLCNKATELLITTDLSVEQISSILKFSSSGYFRKIFKEHTGQTPRGFRRLYSF